MSKYKYKDIASEYDNMVKQYNWQAPEMIYKYLSVVVQKHTKMLDIGAGTGISSERFRDKQVEIYGLDNSDELIEVCKSKGIFKEVLLIDILKDRLPYPDLTFDYVVCSGVFHFFSYLEDIFEKVCNVLKKGGYFTFTVIDNNENNDPFLSKPSNGTEVFHHSYDYIKSLRKRFDFMLYVEQNFKAIKDLNTKETLDYKLIILKKE